MIVRCDSLYSSGSPESFTLEVRPAGDYPLDVYFLMDFSASMGDDLNSVKNLADTIGKDRAVMITHQINTDIDLHIYTYNVL